jgi:hypothetical protein
MGHKWKLITGLALSAGFGFAGTAWADCPGLLTLPTNSPSNSVTFGDGISYSLPILGLDVQSSPGQISDCIVVATGSSGTPVTTNVAGMDNAYATPNGTGGSPYFRTGDTTFPASPDPDQVAPFTGDLANSWDTTLSALSSFLAGQDMVIYFNHNQTNSGSAVDQDLFIWAQIALQDTDPTCVSTLAHPCTVYYYITSSPNATGIDNFGVPGGDPLAFTGPQTADTCLYPSTGSPDTGCGGFPLGGVGTPLTDVQPMYMVRALGQVCLNGPVGVGTPVPCGSPAAVTTVNENLGADHVANAVVFPEINTILASANFQGYDVLHADIRMGCNTAAIASTGGVCPAGSELNNGFEQIFIGRLAPTPGPPSIPEPGSLWLLGLGLLAIAAYRVRLTRK